MSFNKAFIRFSVFLSCPCHDRYSSNACSVNVMLPSFYEGETEFVKVASE